MNLKKCPDCGGDLENGSLLDQTYGSITVQRYAKAEVTDDKRVFVGSSEENFEDVRKTVAYRCKECNRIFLYALNTVQVENVNKRMKKVWLLFVVIAAVVLSLALFLGLV